jgi:hypothetical protein
MVSVYGTAWSAFKESTWPTSKRSTCPISKREVILRSLIEIRDELAEHCRLLKGSSSSANDNEPEWFITCCLLISVASILIQAELNAYLKVSNSVSPTEWVSAKADVTGTGPEDSATTYAAVASQNTTTAVNRSISRSITFTLILQAIKLILILYMGRNTAKTIELIGSQFYGTAIILLAFVAFMILLSIGAVEKAISKAQEDSKMPGGRLQTRKIWNLLVGIIVFSLLWPWYSLWSASPEY